VVGCRHVGIWAGHSPAVPQPGDVIVSKRDLAGQPRRPRAAVATALNLLLNEQKVQRAPSRGYWEMERVKVHPGFHASCHMGLEHSLENRETVECIS
jgi:hypothetical protein